jgi:hypothetical protein
MNKYLKYSLVGFFALAIILAIFVAVEKRPKPQKNDYFTVEPEPWIEDTPFDNDTNNMRISVSRATRQNSIYELNKQEYFDDKLMTFFSDGIYRGKTLALAYLEKDIGIDAGPEMDPDDGVMEGFILAKKEDDRFVFYLFVDQDWKDKMGYTKVLWSNDFESGVSERPFNFNKEKSGIYIDKLEGSFDWFQKSPRKGGIYLGEISKNTYESRNLSDTSFIYVR